jgi:DNA replication protein DnaC
MSALEAATLPMLLTELRLPTIKRLWPALAEQSNREGWPAERFLTALLEHEMNERETRRIDRHRVESLLPPDKRLSSFDFAAVPTVSKAHVTALVEGDSWLEQGGNLLLFGPPGVGKTHLLAGIGHGLIERVTGCCTPAPATWSNVSRRRVGICGSRRNWPSWTALMC